MAGDGGYGFCICVYRITIHHHNDCSGYTIPRTDRLHSTDT